MLHHGVFNPVNTPPFLDDTLQGPLSGFQSHCNHHAMMLRQLLDIQALVLQTQHSSEKASAAARSLVQAFFDHAEQYDALYEGRLE
jgi:hypothetical protein